MLTEPNSPFYRTACKLEYRRDILDSVGKGAEDNTIKKEKEEFIVKVNKGKADGRLGDHSYSN